MGTEPGGPTSASPPRLTAATLARVRPDLAPPYDRSGPPSIVHLGVGAFARAHLGSYTDELLRAGRPAYVHGVSLRRPTAEDQLSPQDGLYTLTEREPDEPDATRVLGAFTAISTGADAAVESIAAPSTRLVTLTVTEKGYELDPADAQRPTSALAVLAAGLARRGRTGPPLTVASLDNLLGNGRLLRARVLDAAEALDPGLAQWIGHEVAFPRSVVDRMVPATTEDDLVRVAGQLGLEDGGAVVAERYRSWYVEPTEALADFAEVGVELVDDIEPYEQRKLWLLNGPHSALAYAGLLAGHHTIAASVGDPVISAFVQRLVDDTVAVADLPSALEPAEFAHDALRRFANAALGHTCAQVGADGSRKLPQRLLPVVARRRARGLPTDRFAVVLAAWLAAVAGIAVQGRRLPQPDDPEADRLTRLAARVDLDAVVGGAFPTSTDHAVLGEIATALRHLVATGSEVLRLDGDYTA